MKTLQANLTKATEDNQRLKRIVTELSGKVEEMRCAQTVPPELEDLRTKLEQCPTLGAGVIAEHLQRYAGAEVHRQKLYTRIDQLEQELTRKEKKPGARLERLEQENQLLRRSLETERQEQLLAREGLILSPPTPLSDLEAKGNQLFSVRHSLTEALLGMRRLQDTHFQEEAQSRQLATGGHREASFRHHGQRDFGYLSDRSTSSDNSSWGNSCQQGPFSRPQPCVCRSGCGPDLAAAFSMAARITLQIMRAGPRARLGHTPSPHCQPYGLGARDSRQGPDAGGSSDSTPSGKLPSGRRRPGPRVSRWS
jgi:hypothetical protein